MKPATLPRSPSPQERLLRIDPGRDTFDDSRAGDLPRHFRAGDLLVVNDAATLPASVRGVDARGREVELRLLEAPERGLARAVLFGSGDWRTPTEHRPAPPRLRPGARLQLGGLEAEVASVDERHARLVTLRFLAEGAALWGALYHAGRPIQYSHLRSELELWDPQTSYAARPWAVEMPSAGRPLRWEVLLELRRRGVELAQLTHAAGISSSGDPALDAALPLRERYEIPADTAEAVARARARGGRVVAAGTSVVRALESAARPDGSVTPGRAETELVLGPGYRARVAQGLLTGLHEPTASHFALLQAFAPRALLERAYAHAEQVGYLGHEFGDASLVLSD